MASRGMLRLGSQITLSKQYEWKVSRILTQTLQSQQGRSSPGNSVDNCKRCSLSGQRYMHTVTPCNNSTIFHKKLSTDQYRGYKTSTFQEREDSPEDDEVNGNFDKFNISEVTQNKLRRMGINHLFPVQYHTFKPTTEETDVIVQARTGTGKTLSFALPLVEKIQKDSDRLRQRGRKPLVVVLAPTRELASQVEQVFSSLSDTVKVACLYGGASFVPQVEAIRRGVDVVVGTPGRMKDLMNQGVLDLSQLRHVILDEVDRMLDMGFDEQVEDIIKDCYTKGDKPQTMLYSATMPDWVRRTAKRYLDEDYEMINLVGKEAEQTATTIKQYAVMCRASEQPTLIRDFIHMHVKETGRAIVFCQTKKEVDSMCLGVLKKEAKAFHGDISQASRTDILQGFKDGKFKVLVTTDVAARGLDIPNIDLVIQAQPPNDTSYYIHRVGRTGRAGQTGMSILMYEPSETQAMKECERLAKIKFEKVRPPTIDQLIEWCVKSAASDIVNVPEELGKHFHEAAEMMIEEKGATEMLAAAMALVSKAGTYFNRSLITRQEGYNTLQFSEGRMSQRYPGSKIRDYLQKLNIPIQNVHSRQDGQGVVFDVETDNVQAVLKGFDEIKSSDTESIERVTVLPEIVQDRFKPRVQTRSKSWGNHKQQYRRTNRHRDYLGDDGEDDFEPSYKRQTNTYRYNDNRYDKSYKSSDRYNARHDSYRDSYYSTFKPSDRGQYNSKKKSQRYDNFFDDED